MKKKTPKIEQQSLPFTDDIESGHYFSESRRKTVLDNILYSLEQGSDVVILTGETGTGKTVLCKKLLEDLPEEICCVYFPKILEAFDDVVRVLALQLGIEQSPETISANTLVEHIVSCLHAEKKHLLAIFDDADGLYLATIERIRKMVYMVNGGDGNSGNYPLFQVVFVGTPTLLVHLKQLLIVDHIRAAHEDTFELEFLSLAETFAYLNHLFQYMRGGVGRNPFTMPEANKIHDASGGNMRVITDIAQKYFKENVAAPPPLSGGSQSKKAIPAVSLGRYAKRMGQCIGHCKMPVVAGCVVLCCLGLLWSLSRGGPDVDTSSPLAHAKPNVPNVAIVHTMVRSSGEEIEKRSTLSEKKETILGTKHENNENRDTLPSPPEESAGADGGAGGGERVTRTRIVVGPLEEKYRNSETKAAEASGVVVSSTGETRPKEEKVIEHIENAAVTPAQPESEGAIQKIVCTKTKKIVAVQMPSDAENDEGRPDVAITGEKLPSLPSMHPQTATEDNILLIHAEKQKKKEDAFSLKEEREKTENLEKVVFPVAPVVIRADKGKIIEKTYVDAMKRGAVWQNSEEKGLYTLQLMVLTEPSAIDTLHGILQRQEFRDLADKFYILKNSSTIFVYYGEYTSFESVRQAKNSLPEFLKKYDPFPLSVKEAVQKSVVGM